jgi:cysteinyl-tRNA synthetase
MPIRFYNTLTRQKEMFEPLVPGKVGMYACGPTVYNYAHIGNLRTFMFEDLLRRHLEYRGFDVTHVMNITDVEDKIIRTCRETGEDLKSLTNRYTEAFFEDLDTLGILRPHHIPRATEYIGPMVELVKKLRDRGHTYDDDGSVYYRIGSFEEYGKLSHIQLENLQAGASGRVDVDEYSAEDPRDFALWKAYTEDDGDVYWETDLGKGRPGWHLECSAMSMGHLGESFDIHCGGVDLVFPHHENEIAQSEGATGKPFARYWLHAAHLNLEGQKISKSLGNVVNLRDLLNEGIDPIAIRYALRATHYRQPTNFSRDALDSAREAVQRVRDFRRRLGEVRMPTGADLQSECEACETAFAEALNDDLNISGALGSVFEFIRATNKLIDEDGLSKDGAGRALDLLDRLDQVVCVLGDAPEEAVPGDIQKLVDERQAARRSKDFARADALRDELTSRGWVLEDTPAGPHVRRA